MFNIIIRIHSSAIPYPVLPCGVQVKTCRYVSYLWSLDLLAVFRWLAGIQADPRAELHFPGMLPETLALWWMFYCKRCGEEYFLVWNVRKPHDPVSLLEKWNRGKYLKQQSSVWRQTFKALVGQFFASMFSLMERRLRREVVLIVCWCLPVTKS